MRRRKRRSATARLLPGPSEVERPRGLRVRAPPGASPGGGGGSAGARREGARWGAGDGGDRSPQLGRPLLPPGHFGLPRPAVCRRAPLAGPLAPGHQPPPRPRGARARPRIPGGRRAEPRDRARPRAGAALPPAVPPPHAPPPPVGASSRAAALRRVPAVPAGKVARPLRDRAAPPLRPPPAREGPADRTAFLPDGVFAGALGSLSLPSGSLARFLSFLFFFFSLRSPARGAFSARAARARLLAPSFLLGPAERGGRQLSPPPCTRAPAEAAAPLRAPTHSNMARTQGACARAPYPPPPTPPQLRGPPGDPLPSPRAWGAHGSRAWSCTGEEASAGLGPLLWSRPQPAHRRGRPRGRGGAPWASDPRRRREPSAVGSRALGMQRRVLAPAWVFGEKDLTLAPGQSGSAGPKVPDPSIPGEARHCSPHVTTSSKMALAERQRLSRSPMGACRCRKVCARRPGHIGNPACPSET